MLKITDTRNINTIDSFNLVGCLKYFNLSEIVFQFYSESNTILLFDLVKIDNKGIEEYRINLDKNQLTKQENFYICNGISENALEFGYYKLQIQDSNFTYESDCFQFDDINFYLYD